jgi:hypothetical protein
MKSRINESINAKLDEDRERGVSMVHLNPD